MNKTKIIFDTIKICIVLIVAVFLLVFLDHWLKWNVNDLWFYLSGFVLINIIIFDRHGSEIIEFFSKKKWRRK